MARVGADISRNNSGAEEGAENNGTPVQEYNGTSRTFNNELYNTQQEQQQQTAQYRNKRPNDVRLNIPGSNLSNGHHPRSQGYYYASNPTTPLALTAHQVSSLLADQAAVASHNGQLLQQQQWAAWRAHMVPQTPGYRFAGFQPAYGWQAQQQQQAMLSTPGGWQPTQMNQQQSPAGGVPTSAFFSLPSATPQNQPMFAFHSTPSGTILTPTAPGGLPSPFNLNAMNAALPSLPHIPSTPVTVVTPRNTSMIGGGGVSSFGFGPDLVNQSIQFGIAQQNDVMRQYILNFLQQQQQQRGVGLQPNDFATRTAGAGVLPPIVINKEQRYEQRSNGDVVAYVDVDSRELAAEVVGKTGRNIKQIEMTTNTKILAPVHDDGSEIARPMAMFPSEGASLSFTVIGAGSEVKQAVNELRQRIVLVKSIQQDRTNRARPSHGQIVRHLAVPARLVCSIVGQQGQEINRVADRCGCYVLSPKEDRDAIFHIVGSEPNTRACVQRICDFIWKREQASLFTLLQRETWRREHPGMPESQKSPSECRKLCGYMLIGTGTELLGGIEMRQPMRDHSDSIGSSKTTASSNHNDGGGGTDGAGSDDGEASSGYYGGGTCCGGSEEEEGDATAGPAKQQRNNKVIGGIDGSTSSSQRRMTSPTGGRTVSSLSSVSVGPLPNDSPRSVGSAQPTPLRMAHAALNGM